MTRDAAWTAFDQAAAEAASARIVDQFAADPDRLGRMSVEAAGLYVDLSKQSWTRAAFNACLDLARASDVEGRRAALFAGEAVNLTEGRAVLHPALRAAPGAGFKALGQPVSAEVDAVRADMKAYADAVRSGAEMGATGRRFEAIVHVGIGGSDLGPRVVWDALRPLDPAIDLRFVANIDPRDMAEALTGLDPETTLVVVVSKTFTTQETLANAEAAKAWLAAALPSEGMTKHFIGVTAAPDRAAAFGCGRTFAFRDWVGGALFAVVGGQPFVRHRPGLGRVRGNVGRGGRHGRSLRLGAAGAERADPAGPGPGVQRRWLESPGADGGALCPCASPPAVLPAAAGDGIER